MGEPVSHDSEYTASSITSDEQKSREQLILELEQLRRIIGRFEMLRTSSKRPTGVTPQEASAFLLHAIDHIGDGIVVADTNGIILSANLPFAVMHGYSVDELIGKRMADLCPEDRNPSQEPMGRHTGSPGGLPGRIWHRHRDGYFFPTTHRHFAMRTRGDAAGILEIVRPIDLHAAEQSTILGSAAQALRTPLTCIKGLAGSLGQADTEWQETTRRGLLDTIDQEVDQIRHTADDLSTLSGIESGQVTFRQTRASTADILTGICQQPNPQTAEYPFDIHMPENLPPVYADAGWIRQVIQRLIRTAAGIWPEGTRIGLEATYRGGEVVMDVVGEGNPAAENGLDSKGVSGSDGYAPPEDAQYSLELAICQRIIEKHGGRWNPFRHAETPLRFSFSLPVIHDRPDISRTDAH